MFEESHELASHQASESFNLRYTCIDHKNYLRTKRELDMKY